VSVRPSRRASWRLPAPGELGARPLLCPLTLELLQPATSRTSCTSTALDAH
jgi:hypothetical protein